MISYISDLEEGTGMGNYATQLYRHMKELGADIENVPVNMTSSGFAPRIKNEFLKVPGAYLISDGDTVFLPEMNYGGLRYVPTRKNLVVTVHDIIPILTDYAPWISRRIMKRQVKVMEKADKIIAISEHTKKDIVENLDVDERDVKVVYQGVDTEMYYPVERDEEVLRKYGIEGDYLLYVGAEKDRKNFDGTLRIFSKILEERPELTLVKVGSPGRQRYRDKHKDLVKKLGIEDDVNFTGFVDQEDLNQIYSSAEALLQLSHYEGFGRAPLEAMSCGTLPIVADRTSLPEVVGDLGVKIDMDENPEEQILESLEEETVSDELIKRAGKFNWKKTAEGILEALR